MREKDGFSGVFDILMGSSIKLSKKMEKDPGSERVMP